MNNNNYEDDESSVKLTIEELEGVPMLRVQTLDKDDAGNYKVPKIQIDMSKLFERDRNLSFLKSSQLRLISSL